MSGGNFYSQDEKPIVRKPEPKQCNTWVWLNGKPNDHRCKLPALDNGLCKRHQPETIAKEKVRRLANKKSKIELGCALCGAATSKQSGLIRCVDPKCGHTHGQGYAFEEPSIIIKPPKFPEYEPIVPRDIDKELK